MAEWYVHSAMWPIQFDVFEQQQQQKYVSTRTHKNWNIQEIKKECRIHNTSQLTQSVKWKEFYIIGGYFVTNLITQTRLLLRCGIFIFLFSVRTLLTDNDGRLWQNGFVRQDYLFIFFLCILLPQNIRSIVFNSLCICNAHWIYWLTCTRAHTLTDHYTIDHWCPVHFIRVTTINAIYSCVLYLFVLFVFFIHFAFEMQKKRNIEMVILWQITWLMCT